MRRMLIAAALALGAGAAMAQTGQTIRIGLQDDIGSLDLRAQRAARRPDRACVAAATRSSISSPDQKIVPMLATSWTTSADGRDADRFEAAQRREVPERRAVQRGRRQGEPRPRPHAADEQPQNELASVDRVDRHRRLRRLPSC